MRLAFDNADARGSTRWPTPSGRLLARAQLVRLRPLLATLFLFPVATPAPPDSTQEAALTNWDDADGTLTLDAAYLDGNLLTAAGRISKGSVNSVGVPAQRKLFVRGGA